ncbi:cwf18 pre-mRNA splicing factor-domain-containing protein [Schizothecium vesticola]|uniref:Cwf18 pre-mRNA splicing factor-domain-containing protein n=1 Tax=Schizothecium vesticola TaxID=314040 RepID=A0AA40EKN3_9PEZI|nr:cwf18 pre-mRNA splicing factor-domain-containing protein [Schizothecium vesticola]
MSSKASLGAAADDRKSRLAKLNPPTTDVARMHLSGRNYDPSTRGPKLGFEAPPTAGLANPTLEEQAADIEDELQRQAAVDAQDDKGIDLFKLQPKKPNWDLKRELNHKLEVLNVRTDNAIARMVRERLAAKKPAGEGGGSAGSGAPGDEEGGPLEGAAFVEGMRLREREEEDEARREREAEDADLA